MTALFSLPSIVISESEGWMMTEEPGNSGPPRCSRVGGKKRTFHYLFQADFIRITPDPHCWTWTFLLLIKPEDRSAGLKKVLPIRHFWKALRECSAAWVASRDVRNSSCSITHYPQNVCVCMYVCVYGGAFKDLLNQQTVRPQPESLGVILVPFKTQIGTEIPPNWTVGIRRRILCFKTCDVLGGLCDILRWGFLSFELKPC